MLPTQIINDENTFQFKSLAICKLKTAYSVDFTSELLYINVIKSR